MSEAPPREPGLLALLTVVLRRWRPIAGLALVSAAGAAGVTLLLAPSYTAYATFVPAVRGMSAVPAGLAGLASQFGVRSEQAGTSPEFFAELLGSRPVMTQVLATRLPNPERVPDAVQASASPADSAALLDLLGIEASSPARRLEAGIGRLARMVGTRVNAKTGVVRVSVSARSPRLAADVANQLLAALRDFNLHSRQSQAVARRAFVEGRLAEAQGRLAAAEAELKTFYDANRMWRESPTLLFREGQLRRQVEIRQELFVSLSREHEAARIEEVYDAPVINVIDAAVAPVRRTAPRRTSAVLFAFLIGALLAAAVSVAADAVRSAERRGDREVGEFGRAWRSFVGEVRPPFRRRPVAEA